MLFASVLLLRRCHHFRPSSEELPHSYPCASVTWSQNSLFSITAWDLPMQGFWWLLPFLGLFCLSYLRQHRPRCGVIHPSVCLESPSRLYVAWPLLTLSVSCESHSVLYMEDVIVVIECWCGCYTRKRAVQLLRRPAHRRLKSNVNLKWVGQPAALGADGAGDLNLSTLSLVCLLCPVKACLDRLRKLNPL